MTDPTKLTMDERREMVDRMLRLVRGTQDMFLFAGVSYLTMSP
jgi:hypothetical protein